MKSQDAQEFGDSWDQCAELYGKTVSPEAKEMAFKLLVNYELLQIKQALQAHMLDPDGGRFMPKPADVVGKIQILSPSGFPGAEQAWAQFPRNDAQTACICQEMSKAWGIACELDEITGRMAFKEAYNREVALAKATGKGPVWFVSVGSDKSEREQVILEAVAAKQISPKAAQVHLPHIPSGDLLKLSTQELTANNLLENHAQTVTSMDQVLLSAPVADKETALAHIAGFKKLIGVTS